jgi:hypothetical protein
MPRILFLAADEDATIFLVVAPFSNKFLTAATTTVAGRAIRVTKSNVKNNVE